jgi:peroxidase
MTCMDMSRSRNAFPTFNCQTTNQREQLNLLTSFLDGSQIYGFDKNSNDLVRLFQGGLLKFNQGINQPRAYLPMSNTDNSCGDASGTIACFQGGEERTNENMGLVGLQTLFMREHNRIATELARVNPFWNDQKLFDETRRIIIGIYQHIIYSQYLPTIVGQTLSSQAGLLPSPPFSPPFNGYDPAINPSIGKILT